MPLDNGVRLGPYEIVAPLGAGGMGEVYKARDTRLNRTVAIKVLPDVADAESRGRLQREARAIAALNHPHICVLHDVGSDRAVDYLVLEHLDGETLADRLRRADDHRLPIDVALIIAGQIADALDAAHGAGIVHRDLKPANIFLVRGGGASAPTVAKLLDFGLAKTVDSTVAAHSIAATMDAARTEPGMILGTCQYMSPEQVEGRAADARSDVFAFGAVVYEMVAGRKAFPAESPAGAMSAILKDTPPLLSTLQPLASPALDFIVGRCLEKAQDNRWQSMRDVGLIVRQIAARGWDPLSAPARSRNRQSLFVAAALGLAATAFAGGYLARSGTRNAAPASGPIRLSIVAPEGTVFTPRDITAAPQFALSPGGDRIAMVAGALGESPRLWVRPLDSTTAQAIAGTEDASGPFWAPDGRAVAFFARRKLKVVALDGGAVRDLADVAFDVTGGTWSKDGVILFGGATGTALSKVPAAGGPVEPATRFNADRKEMGHRWPQFLPDGRHFLFFSRSAVPVNTGIYIASLDAPDVVPIAQSMASGVYAPAGFVLFEKNGTLMSQPVDPAAFVGRGEPSPLADRVWGMPGPSLLPISIAANGTMAYWAGDRPPSQLRWFDRSGRPLGAIGEPKQYVNPRLSSDGGRVLVTVRTERQLDDLWSIVVPSGVESRLTFAPAIGAFGVWSPDADTVIHSRHDRGAFRLFQKASNGVGEAKVLSGASSNWALFPEDWSRDGQSLIYTTNGETAWDLWAMDIASGAAHALMATPNNELQARVSPDGRWLAYTSDESGRWNVYVTSFPGAVGKWQVSTDGGSQPQWRGDGNELFFIAPDGRLTATSVRGGAALEFGARQPLFQTPLTFLLAPYRSDYAAAPDGQRFLINTSIPDAAPQTITIVLNQQRGGRE